MQVTFCGAAGSVTGSCFWIKTENMEFLVDCGMFQGSKEEREKNRREFLFNPGNIRYVLLTHAHIDIFDPARTCKGLRGACTHATKIGRCELPDSGHIQEMEAEWRSRKKVRLGEPPVEPFILQQNVQCLQHFYIRRLWRDFELAWVRVRLRCRPYLGSAIIEFGGEG